jgi:hypothetical protein
VTAVVDWLTAILHGGYDPKYEGSIERSVCSMGARLYLA